MAWRTIHHADEGFIETFFGGELTPGELKAAIEENMRLALERACFVFLADCSGLRGGHSVFDLYGMLEFLLTLGLPPDFKEALLMPAEGLAEGVEFWETACLNRGINARVFDDRSKALAWLME